MSNQITRRRVLGAGALAAPAAVGANAGTAVATSAPADVPLIDRARVWVNTYLIDRASAEQWARRHLAAGELFAVWPTGEAA